MNYILLQDEINLIKDSDKRNIIISFLKSAPDYIEHVSASSSGKYHPSFDHGEGGLIRHIKMTVAVAQDLIRLENYDFVCNCDNLVYPEDMSVSYSKKEFMDNVIAACLLHDIYKNGYEDSNRTVFAHPAIAAYEFRNFIDKIIEETKSHSMITKLEKFKNEVADAVETHMGQWCIHKPKNRLEKIVHLADYISSRKFFDKFKD